MEPKNVDAQRFEFFTTKLEKNASENYAFDVNGASFSQSIDVNTIRIKKEALDSVFVGEDGFLETKVEIEEHDLYHSATHLCDTETFYYRENDKDLDTTSKSVISAKELDCFFNCELKQNLKKDCASTVSSECDSDGSKSIDLTSAVESDIKSRNFYENDMLSEAFLSNAVNESDISEIFSKERSKQLKRKIERQLKWSVILNKTEIPNFNSKNIVEGCTLKKRNTELLGTTEYLYVHLQQQDLYELQRTYRRNQSQNNGPEKSTRHHWKKADRLKIFRCSVCLFKSTTKFQLAVHIVENHKEVARAKNMMETQYMFPGSSPNEILFKCNECSFVRKQKYLLRSHLLTHKSVDECEQTFRCASCPYVAKDKSLIVSHMLVHIPAERRHTHKCPHCDFRTKHHIYIRRHIENMHRLEKKSPNKVVMYTCNFCPFSTKYKDSMTRHQTIHLGVSKEDMIPCTLCSYKICFQGKSKKLLKQHMLIHKPPEEVVMYKCDLCSFSTKRKNGLIQHQTVHGVSEKDMIPCSLCSYKAKNKKGFSKHMHTHLDPSQITMYKCDQCTRQFRRHSHMKNHALTHKNKDERPTFRCDRCEYKATLKDSLRTHYKMKHMDPSEIDWKRCEKCEFKTRLLRNLKQHSLVHKKPGDLDMFQCAQCPYSAKRKDKLKAHIEKHMNVCYKCPMCSFKTKTRSSLYIHKRKVHQQKSQA